MSLRIVHFGYSDITAGAARASYHLHRGLLMRGVDSWMVVARKLSNDPRVVSYETRLGDWWSRTVFQAEILPKRVAYYLPNRLMSSLEPDSALAWVGTGLVRQVPRMMPDIVQLHWICGGLVRPEGLRLLKNHPIVWRLADMWPLSGAEHYSSGQARFREGYLRDNRPASLKGPDVSRWVWKRKRRAYAELSDLTIVCPSHWMADLARESALFADRDIRVIPTGIDCATFRPSGHIAARETLGLPRDVPVLLTGAARLHNPRKGFEQVLSALPQIEEALGRNVILVAFGTPPSSLEPPRSNVRFLGELPTEQMIVAYNAADVFIVPSLEDNLPNTALEAAACGLPIAAFDVGGIREVVVEGETGHLAKVTDATSLAKAITTLLRAPIARRKKLSENARKKAEVMFDYRTQAGSYIALYNEILERRRSVPSSLIGF